MRVGEDGGKDKLFASRILIDRLHVVAGFAAVFPVIDPAYGDNGNGLLADRPVRNVNLV